MILSFTSNLAHDVIAFHILLFILVKFNYSVYLKSLLLFRKEYFLATYSCSLLITKLGLFVVLDCTVIYRNKDMNINVSGK